MRSGFSTETGDVRLSEVLGSLSYALDLTEGQRPGHAVRSCLIGMRLAEIVGIPAGDRSDLFYALLLKDLGCSSNAARFAALFGANDHDIKTDLQHIDWSNALSAFRFVVRNAAPGGTTLSRIWRVLGVLSRGPEGPRAVVRTRCEQGAAIAAMLGFRSKVVAAIRALDEHWDGSGQPYGLRRDEIPLLARILNLSQTVEVFVSTYGVLTAYKMAGTRRGRWFDPALVDALYSMRADHTFWASLGSHHNLTSLRFFEPADRIETATEDRLDLVAEAFARVVDAKSPWTYRHSTGVADFAVGIARQLGLDQASRRQIRRAALLHDLGKLGISNLILDKPDKLTDDEMREMRRHPAYTAQILRRASCFAGIADHAAAHHERLDGTGYHRGSAGGELSLPARILCVADVCDALRSSRPYRAGLPADRVLAIMKREAGRALDGDCVAAVSAVLASAPAEHQSAAPAARLVSDLAEDYHQAA